MAEGGTAVVPAGARMRDPWPQRAAWITAVAGVLIALFSILRPASAPTVIGIFTQTLLDEAIKERLLPRQHFVCMTIYAVPSCSPTSWRAQMCG